MRGNTTGRVRVGTTKVPTGRSRIFISYRHGVDEYAVGRLAEELRKHFPRDQVFEDIASIDPGSDFVEALQRGLDTCAAVLVVIGPNWVTVTDRQGRRRLDLPDDWVRHEVSESLRNHGVRVFPLLLDSEMPGAEDLPEPLQSLTRRQAFPLTGRHWANDVAQLISFLKKVPGLTANPVVEAKPSPTKAASGHTKPPVKPAAMEHPPAAATSKVAGKPPTKPITRQSVVVVGDETAIEVAAKLRNAKISVSEDKSLIGSASMVVIATDATRGGMPKFEDIVSEVARSSNRKLLWVLTKSSDFDPELIDLDVSDVWNLLDKYDLHVPGDKYPVAVDAESGYSGAITGWAAIIRFVAG
jgi:hypothetical protein